MFNLLKSDFYKLRKSKAFYICAAVSVVIGVITMVAFQQIINIAGSGEERGPAGGMAGLTGSGSGLLGQALSQGMFITLIAVFVSIFVSSEFHNGTVKNTLSRGSDRTKVFLSKFIVCSCAALAIFAAFTVSALVTGTAMWGYDPAGTTGLGAMIGMIGYQALLTVCYTAFFVFISMTVRSSGGTIAANVLCVLMVSTLLSALNALFSITSFDLNDFWLGGALERLATLAPSTADIWQGILAGVLWGAASIAGGMVLFRKRDVK